MNIDELITNVKKKIKKNINIEKYFNWRQNIFT